MIRIQHELFDINAEIAALARDRADIGAVVTFTGFVRGTDGVSPISAMTLEHYPGMTEKELERIEAEAHARWPIRASTIIHRVGRLEAGAPIVLVVTASESRQAAFDAASFLMDYLKTSAPFWKSEERAGKTRWVDARDSDEAARDRWKER